MLRRSHIAGRFRIAHVRCTKRGRVREGAGRERQKVERVWVERVGSAVSRCEPGVLRWAGSLMTLNRILRNKHFLAMAVTSASIASHSANAAIFTWDGGGTANNPGTGSWNTAANWTGNAVPTSATT